MILAIVQHQLVQFVQQDISLIQVDLVQNAQLETQQQLLNATNVFNIAIPVAILQHHAQLQLQDISLTDLAL